MLDYYASMQLFRELQGLTLLTSNKHFFGPNMSFGA